MFCLRDYKFFEQIWKIAGTALGASIEILVTGLGSNPSPSSRVELGNEA